MHTRDTTRKPEEPWDKPEDRVALIEGFEGDALLGFLQKRDYWKADYFAALHFLQSDLQAGALHRCLRSMADNINIDKFPFFTELAYRAMLLIRQPTNEKNCHRYLAITNELLEHFEDDSLFQILKNATCLRASFANVLQPLQTTVNDSKDLAAATLIERLNAAKNTAQQDDLPRLAELAYRANLLIQQPKHEKNRQRYLALIKQLNAYSWGQVVGIAALCLLATVTFGAMVASIIAISSGTAAVPLVAWNIVKASYLVTMMEGVITALAASSGYHLFHKPPNYSVVTQAGLNLFKTVTDVKDSLAVAGGMGLSPRA